MPQNYVGLLGKKYSAHNVEQEVFRYWNQNRIYEKVKKQRAAGPKFYFLDGPPFPSSDVPHIGTCWNKLIKDVVLRYRRARGFNVRDQPGYDCHGLPIELTVERMLDFKSKKDVENFGVDRFVAECKSLAARNSEAMSRVFMDLGVWMDWSKPYITHENSYIESAWWTIKEAHKSGLLNHGQKVVHWCSRCETVLSDYEVVMEYQLLKDPSIYVKFPVEGRENEFIVIWTTTPWTLPSNVAVMVHPDFEYVKARCGVEAYIIAKQRLEPFSLELGKKLEVQETFLGKSLEGLRYRSPLAHIVPAQSKIAGSHRVVLSREHVTLEEGTGCVHTAPGHGEEDFEVGVQNSLPVLMLVNNQGKFVDEAGKYSGEHVLAANREILEDLKKAGALLFSGVVEHRVPVCWRCKTPLLLRATDQWFLGVKKLKDEMIREADRVRWVPEWAGGSQFRNWLAGLRDWVISRQRFWGSPLPVWVCSSCGGIIVIGSYKELREKAVDQPELADLHVPWVDSVVLRCSCGGEMRRVPDVLVCWFDSGISSYASLGHPRNLAEKEYWWPADFIVEGRDQISGWFFSLLKAGIVSFKRSPYETVLMHGFLLDEHGHEMHKSLGNYVSPDEVVGKFGRDALRVYVLQSTLWEDLKFSWSTLSEVVGDLNTIWNIYVFASTYMNLDSFNPDMWRPKNLRSHMRPEDLWLMSRLQGLVEAVTSSLESYRLHEAVRAVRGFYIEDLSHNYIRLVRRRTWIEKDDPDKLSAYSVLYNVLKTSLVLLAPFTPFIAEQIYLDMFSKAESKASESIHMTDWPKVEKGWVDRSLEESMMHAQSILAAIASARMNAKLKLRQPVRSIAVVSGLKEVKDAVSRLRRIILDQGNTKKITVIPPSGEKNLLRKRSAKLVSSEFSGGKVYVDTALTMMEVAEGLSRDIVRRMQQMRREMNLPVDAYVKAFIVAPDNESKKLLGKRRRYICEEVRVKELSILGKDEEAWKPEHGREWSIGDKNYTVGLNRLTVK